ncbi:MAG: aminotransferase class V-fold PLP-dependent enzyme [Armatimonadota bacterium]|nr:aminotransferase class V-fold PLP-dependent enzyme [Armatimonadota bacterium]
MAVMVDSEWLERVRSEIVGLETFVPVLSGQLRRYVNLDNAATTPALVAVRDAVDGFLDWYSSVHRGTGFKSRLATHWYEESRRIVLEAVGGDPDRHVVVFVRNTTEGMNLLAHRVLTADPDGIILTSVMEHHSDMLPWRLGRQVRYLAVDRDGGLHEEELERQLAQAGGRVTAVTLSGASNVTGVVPPIHRLATIARAHGARFFVDGAQLVPHRRVRMGDAGDPGRLDALVFSGHKIYAPYGAGAVVASRALFERGQPMLVGGGMVRSVTLDDAEWTDAPESDEAGSPNVVGAVALATALRALAAFGMDHIEAHEAALVRYALPRLLEIPGLTLYGPRDPDHADRLGVFTFNLQDRPHGLVAAVLGYEHAIGVRNGCFCAHPLLYHLLGLRADQIERFRAITRAHRHAGMPGAVRASLGIYNTPDDVDTLVASLRAVAAGDYAGTYEEHPITGDYAPVGVADPIREVFDLSMYLPAQHPAEHSHAHEWA